MSTDILAFSDPWADRQDFMPEKMAAELTYDVGLALGVAAGAADHSPLAPFLLDAVVLTRRHNREIAARLMGVSKEGLDGFLDGARDHRLFQVWPDSNYPQP